ncbi:hypothetical protein [Fibrella aquatilis]|uniref:Uncharacterized protein n=1 Tax=Fibrella aquatilis TaxID=2817059 RepID=A0A939G6I9_9BACT|nr:hypothetical protein [Fibrella aquatilis]MBO0932776.1 hypothetical protein [Fibrella aquatilis]
MKTVLFNALLWLISHCAAGQTSTQAMTHKAKMTKKIALACQLTAPEQIKRMNELHQTLFKKINRLTEYKHSYEIVFQQPDDKLLAELIEFIEFERVCCPWLKFQLTIRPNKGPVSLKMGDSVETKEMTGLVMGLTNRP